MPRQLYEFRPLNEGQSMNARTTMRMSSRAAAKAKAENIAAAIQTVLPGCDISCQVSSLEPNDDWEEIVP
jgi:hypothetical protein